MIRWGGGDRTWWGDDVRWWGNELRMVRGGGGGEGNSIGYREIRVEEEEERAGGGR